MSDEPPRPANVPPGYDEADPYEGEDLSTYPDWWRRNVYEFREHGMRPYRPPRFADGTYTPEVIEALEAELGVRVRIRCVDPEPGEDWEVRVDGERVGTVARTREGEGYTQYGPTAAEFEALVREAVEER